MNAPTTHSFARGLKRLLLVWPFALALTVVVLTLVCIEVCRDLRAALGWGKP